MTTGLYRLQAFTLFVHHIVPQRKNLNRQRRAEIGIRKELLKPNFRFN